MLILNLIFVLQYLYSNINLFLIDFGDIMKIKSLLLFILMNCSLVLNAQWIPTNGPYGGIINCFAVKGNNFYVGTDLKGVFLTTDNGKNWNAISSDKIYAEILCLVVKNEMLFAATGSGLYVTSDNGNSWSSAGLDNKRVFTIAISGNFLFANVNHSNTYVSADNGKTWMESGSILANSILLFAVSGKYLYAGTASNGIILSSDFGKNWTEINNGLPNYPWTDFLMCYEGDIYAGINGGIFVSSNNGENWIKKSTGLTNINVQALAVKDSLLVAGTKTGIFISEDKGENWIASGLSNKNVQALIFINDAIWAGTSDDGVYVSSNKGRNWLSAGITCQYVSSFFQKGDNLFAGCGGIYVTSNNGNRWINTGLSNKFIKAITISGQNLIAGTFGFSDGIFISSDDGINWVQSNTGLSNKNIEALAVCGKYVFAGTNDNNVFISTDNGASWTESNNGIANKRINTFAVSGENIFAAGPSGVFISSNYGAEWKYSGLYYVNVLAVNGSTLFAGTNGTGVSISSDNGATWRSTNFGNAIIHALYVYNGVIFAGKYRGDGVFASTDNGNSWMQVSTGLVNLDVEAFIVKDGILFAGTFGSSVWQRKVSEMITSVNGNANQIIPDFSLSQNYPNPFNPSTVIDFELAERSCVQLKITDILGRDIATLVNEVREPGKYSVNYNAGNLSSGIYFYILKSGSNSVTRKMLLLR